MKILDTIEQLIDHIKQMYQWFIHRKVAIVLSLVFSLAFPLYIVIITVFMPVRTAGKLDVPGDNSILAEDTAKVGKDISSDVMEKVKQLEKMEMEKAFLKNRMTLAAKSDSVYMTLDLGDSLLNLEINGVVVRSCPLTYIRESRRLGRIDHERLYAWASTPFQLERELSTIPKIPYVIKEAPKDTLEAQEQSAIPLPPDTTSVFFTLFFDKELVIEIEQSAKPDDVDMGMIDKYYRDKNKVLRKDAFRAALGLHPPKQEIYLRLQVSQEDARAIYRGIPVHASLALRL